MNKKSIKAKILKNMLEEVTGKKVVFKENKKFDMTIDEVFQEILHYDKESQNFKYNKYRFFEKSDIIKIKKRSEILYIMFDMSKNNLERFAQESTTRQRMLNNTEFILDYIAVKLNISGLYTISTDIVGTYKNKPVKLIEYNRPYPQEELDIIIYDGKKYDTYDYDIFT